MPRERPGAFPLEGERVQLNGWDAMPVRVLFTTDTHGLLGRTSFQEQVRRLTDKTEPDLMLDGGDVVGHSNLSWHYTPVFREMAQLGYDGIAVGNHDFHEIPLGMHVQCGDERPPLIASNLRHACDGLPRNGMHARECGRSVAPCVWPVSQFVTRMIDGTSVCILGLMPRVDRPSKWFDRKLNRVFRPLLPARTTGAREAIAEALTVAGPRPEVTIVLSHMNLADAEALARSGLPIDLVLCGHAHWQSPLPDAGLRPGLVHYYVPEHRLPWGRGNVAASLIDLDESGAILGTTVYDLRNLDVLARSG